MYSHNLPPSLFNHEGEELINGGGTTVARKLVNLSLSNCYAWQSIREAQEEGAGAVSRAGRGLFSQSKWLNFRSLFPFSWIMLRDKL